jgi:hypothetical protein
VYELISNLGFTLFVTGLAMAILLAFISVWKAHYKKIKISPKQFSRFVWLIGICAVASGVGITISLTIDALPEFSIFRALLTILVCVVLYPILMVGVYIFDVRYYGYLEANSEKKFETN